MQTWESYTVHGFPVFKTLSIYMPQACLRGTTQNVSLHLDSVAHIQLWVSFVDPASLRLLRSEWHLLYPALLNVGISKSELGYSYVDSSTNTQEPSMVLSLQENSFALVTSSLSKQ